MTDSLEFLNRLRQRQRQTSEQHHHTTTQQTPTTGASEPLHGAAYAQAALQRETLNVATATPGTRNDTLNRAAFNLASLVESGHLDANHVNQQLTHAAHTAGLPDTEIQATIASAARGSATKVGPRKIPNPPQTPDTTTYDHTTNNTPNPHTNNTDSSAETQDLHQLAVNRRAYELRLNDEARRLYNSQLAAQLHQQAPPPQTLTNFLATPDTDAVYRITDLLPTGGRVLLAAQYKAGKTTMMANLIRALADGGNFLGHYHTQPANNIVIIDTELDERMLRRWLRTQNIHNTDAVTVLPLRGNVSTFNILDTETRNQWATQLAGADIIILDCLRPCLDALTLSEDKEAGRFLVAFDELCAATGAQEGIVVHHMGHNSERSRGDSRLLDWPDVLWKIIRETHENGDSNENGDRYFSAIGRDVNITESLLDYTPQTGQLMLCGGSRLDKKARTLFDDIINILSNPEHADGLTFNNLTTKLTELGNGRNSARKAVKLAIDQNVITTTPGPRHSALHILNPTNKRGVNE
ncbi:MAG: AAA family ATPase [Mycobacteriaceae bacterium]|nr:AAA family ATPase [Mycobacteriaceae bacterium]